MKIRDERIRAFIAIELPSDVKSRLREFQSGLRRPQQVFVKWVSPDSIHLTLKFLGDITAEQADRINTALKPIAEGHNRFTVHTAETGCFPDLRRVRVFWLGLGGDTDSLLNLQKTVDVQMAKYGFPVENRPFTAHLTIARLKDECTQDQRLEFAELVNDKKFVPEAAIKADSIVLMTSRLAPQGAIYSKLGEHNLKGK
jgi:2'-5' RNA ligase